MLKQRTTRTKLFFLTRLMLCWMFCPAILHAKQAQSHIKIHDSRTLDASEIYQYRLKKYQHTSSYKNFIQLQQSLAKLDMTADTYSALVISLFKQHQLEKAKLLLQSALKRFPNNATLRLLQAQLLIKHHQHKQALKQLLSASASITFANHLTYYAFIAALYLHDGKINLAKQLYIQLIKQQPNQAKWWKGLAICLAHSGNQVLAQQALGKANELANAQ